MTFPGEGVYFLICAIWGSAAGQGMVFRPSSLEQGIQFYQQQKQVTHSNTKSRSRTYPKQGMVLLRAERQCHVNRPLQGNNQNRSISGRECCCCRYN